MERSGKRLNGTQVMTFAGGVEEVDRFVKSDFVQDAQTAVEIEQVRATAQENMLAVIELNAGVLWVFEGGSASAQGMASLDQSDSQRRIKRRLRERDGGGDTRESAADDDDV